MFKDSLLSLLGTTRLPGIEINSWNDVTGQKIHTLERRKGGAPAGAISCALYLLTQANDAFLTYFPKFRD